MKRISLFSLMVLTATSFISNAQNKTDTSVKPEETEVWTPVPKVVIPGKKFTEAPSDAIILFDGKNLDQWESTNNGSTAKWNVANGVVTINKSSGNIQTKKTFTNYQLHIEWKIPETIKGSGQTRGNSGVFLAATNGTAGGYEIQVLDGYRNRNKTYVNGMVGSIYKDVIPLANPSRKAGEWNVYDIAWKAPLFKKDGSLKSGAKVTVFLNGVLVQNNSMIKGETNYIGKHKYIKKGHGPSPIMLQAHGDKSQPISFRNIWVRE